MTKNKLNYNYKQKHQHGGKNNMDKDTRNDIINKLANAQAQAEEILDIMAQVERLYLRSEYCVPTHLVMLQDAIKFTISQIGGAKFDAEQE